jgi:tryptophanyl-tRNA synthetase
VKQRVLTGYRPTGQLHLGHWHGNLQNMLKLQADYDCFFFIADWHALTSEYADPSLIRAAGEEIVLDWEAAGIDPAACHVYRQSDVPETAELALYLSMITPIPWLERVPTYKEQQQQITGRDLSTIGFLEYPLLQTADIIIMRSELVPVGEDQLPHLEFGREVVRRFHGFYGQCFPEPKGMVSEAKRVPGLDGRKMSKSYANAIGLMDPPDVIKKKVGSYITDVQKIRKDDVGRPEICALHDLHRMHPGAGAGEVDEAARACRAGELGCVAHKRQVAENIIADLADFQERRRDLDSRPGLAEEILAEGAAKVKPIADATMADVRHLMRLAE